jgi:HTH-type transcriptional regulator/antitoxin HigA
MNQIEKLMRKRRNTRAEDDMIELLATLVEQYEIRQGYTDPVLSPRDRLAGLMEARGISQTELARRSMVPRTTINEVLCGKRGISKTNAVRLASFFCVSIDEFIGADQ